METNYELKHKCLLVPLKAVLLVIAMVLVGFTTYAQQGKTVKVANDQQLIEAFENHSIETIELAPGYYAFLNIEATFGTKVVKYQNGDGNRSSSGCTYTIRGENHCYRPTDISYPDNFPPLPGYSEGAAQANVINTTCNDFPVLCCPVDGSGVWSFTLKPTGASDPLFDYPNSYTSAFFVDKPGRYKLKYTWDPLVNPLLTEFAEVETEYNFYGPEVFEFSAPDVCGYTTTLDFTYVEGYDPLATHTIEWFLDFFPYGDPVPITGPTVTNHNYSLTVTECGIAVITARYNAFPECFTEVTDTVDFSCEPIADAGPDVNVCDALCYYSLVGSTGLTSVPPPPHVYAYSWVQVSAPVPGLDLTFSPNNGVNELEVGVCREATPECSYGEYQVEFQVQNGLCDDEDDMFLRFYEQPLANAGPDRYICNIFSFNLAADPYDYCGTEGVNFWSENHWELVTPDPLGAITIVDPTSPTSEVNINAALLTPCAFGPYEFKWVENNSKGSGLGGCTDDDNVIVTIYEDPIPDAGDDLVLCDTWAFSLWGIGDEPCYDNTVVVYSWEKSDEPGDCDIQFSDLNDLNPDITISGCDPALCPYGEYIFTLTQSNGYLDVNDDFVTVCSSTDDVSVWIFEPVDADAGVDQHICNSFAFTMTAVPTPFCGDPGVNYFTWGVWSQVSGPTMNVTIDDVNDPLTGVTINDITGCPYGIYQFMWTEYNGFGTPFKGCTGFDLVDIYIDETPESIGAGPDQILCNDFEFALDGSIDIPCTQNTAYSIVWELVSQPDGCVVSITPDVIDPSVSITGCTSCAFGEYVFKVTQMNGYYDGLGDFVMVCEDSDEVSVWIFEEVDADAGIDQHLCTDFTFDLTAVPTPFCGVAGVNYMSNGLWEQVSGPILALIDNANNPVTSVTIMPGSNPCPYGEYKFRWTEFNGFYGPGLSQEGCTGWDEVSIFIYETPVVDAGTDQVYCNDFDFLLDGTVDPLCTGLDYQILWEVVEQPGTCTVDFQYSNSIDPLVSITNCTACEYGVYTFKVTQMNGYYIGSTWYTVCQDSDEVSVWIYEEPVDVSAGLDQELCADYTFDLTGVGATYCGDYDVNYHNWYSWTLVSQPAGADCGVAIANGTALVASVTVGPCTGVCPYGEFVFRFTERNGTDNVYCEDWDEVSVFIFEDPDADAGDDVNACVDIALAPFCYDMTGEMEYCYSMYGTWTKSCGPGLVTFTDVNDPETEVCFDEPGRYKFTWTVMNDAEDCEDEDEVIFDLLEQPTAAADDYELSAPCDELCYSLYDAGIVKYEYFGVETGDCPNFQDMAHWSYVDGPCSDPNSVTFADDTDPATELCVSYYGAYTVRWNEVNVAVDGDSECEAHVDVFVEFYETPTPNAGPDDEICGNCYTLMGELYDYEGGCNQHLNDSFYWELLPGGLCPVVFDPFVLQPQVCISDQTDCYGTYGFVLHEINGDCYGTDTVYICFSEEPDDVAVCFWNEPNECGPWDNGVDFNYNGCLQPNEVLEVCADGYTELSLNEWCNCLPGFDWNNPLLFGWTFEWSVIAPAGTDVEFQDGYYDFEDGDWVYPYVYINWGECCDTARVYLTINSGLGVCGIECEKTLEYKFFVYHKPCIDIVGPDVSEPGWPSALNLYCNDCPENICYLYNWTVEPCGHITDGQGTICINVLWDAYPTLTDGWGEITLTIFDTCTGCCNYDEKPVRIYPTGTLGDCPLTGQVLYHNNSETPLNGVEIQLWNGAIPVMSTVTFTKFFDGVPVIPPYTIPPYTIDGYYEFSGLNCNTNFGVTASYDASWYGANATDALAVELQTIGGGLPLGFVFDDVVEEAMNVNNSPAINGTDALWIKQRAIAMVDYFPAGDWAFEPSLITTAVTDYNIYTLNMGDANRSNIPNQNPTKRAIDLISDGTMNVVTGQEFELPIRIANASEFGAITLNLGYNSALLEVVDVIAAEGMLDNVTNGNVSVAWSSTNPMVLADNDVVMTLKVKAISEIPATESLFSINLGSEFADRTASVIEPVTLKTFGITTAPAAEDYFLSTNRPNPFSTSTFIEYTMPETGKVKLSVLDMLGQEIAVLVNATQTAGSYTVEFSAAGLATGVYIYKITVDGESRDFISTQRMVISH